MIPVRLVLEDFLSYKKPDPLDFTAFHVACLTGENGAGKSSLLDAMTFALFGAARGSEGGKNQDRLIRDGADRASVDFTFSLDGTEYRIVRRRPRAGSGDLRFMVRDGDAWQNLTEDNLKATEARIASVLGMDYRTFTASAFFVQGRSEDFLSRMKPEERKEVFSRLLDLGAYEKLEEAARSRARESEARRKSLAERVAELGARGAELGDIEDQLSGAVARKEDLDAKLAEAEDGLAAARTEAAELEAAAAALDKDRAELKAAIELAEAERKREAAKRAELDELDALLARTEEVDTALAEAGSLREAEARARRLQLEAAELDLRRTELEGRIEAEAGAISARLREARSRAKELQGEVARIEQSRAELEKLEDALGGLEGVDDMLGANRSLLDAQRAEEARLAQRHEHLMDVESKAVRRLDLLGRGEGECPVCGTTLDAQHRRRVKEQLESEVSTVRDEIEAAVSALEANRKDRMRLAEEVKRLERDSQQRQALGSSREAVRARLERADQTASALEELTAEGKLLAEALRTGDFCPEIRLELAEVESRKASLYDAEAHRVLQERLAALEPYAELKGRLEAARSRRERVTEELRVAERAVRGLEASVRERKRALEERQGAISRLPEVRGTLEGRSAAVGSFRRAQAEAAALAARLQERTDAARALSAELEAARASEQQAAAEHRRFRRLTEAFGRGGIPDLVIDNALPELEDDANRILGRLTDHEMSVRFHLKRQTKSGKARDTFEALVHHDGAVRDFAMFSGGEAFRVAFAVRLAMSKLLVRRAGARLETLVVDEGFGTQDPQGRERLVEALALARREFAKVLVITHLDELKDQFGTQIHVCKQDGVSVLRVEAG